MSQDIFPQQQKIRNAELISPPNRLKEKVGSGGIDEAVLMKAQELLERNTINFEPIANMLIDLLVEAIADAKSGDLKGEEAIEAMIYPAMQMKAQGSMFHYPLVSDISHILVNFLETVENTDRDVLDIVIAHKMSIKAVLASHLKGDGGKTGKELREALMEACGRYYRSKKI
ncbi:MAG: hypothetical protein Q8K65_05250 [Alphaproteobacteria bacterium]|nr:hypothetical protein [Alphaproteobacteria bacterium]